MAYHTHSGISIFYLTSLLRVLRYLLQEADSSKSKISLNEIENKDEIDNLTVKQLKIILTNNFVDYRGCKEKHELITKVKMLWDSRQANKRLYEKLLNPSGD